MRKKYYATGDINAEKEKELKELIHYISKIEIESGHIYSKDAMRLSKLIEETYFPTLRYVTRAECRDVPWHGM